MKIIRVGARSFVVKNKNAIAVCEEAAAAHKAGRLVRSLKLLRIGAKIEDGELDLSFRRDSDGVIQRLDHVA